MSRRFFLDSSPPPTGQFSLSQVEAPDEIHHLTRVLRLGAGDTLIFVNGRGLETEARILQADKSSLQLEIITQTQTEQAKPRIHLCQAALKGAKMDWLIEKLTELGVSELHLLTTEFSVRQEENSRLDRWDRIVKSAMKQSENPQWLKIHAPRSLKELFASDTYSQAPKILLHPETNSPSLLKCLQSVLEKNLSLEALFIFLGPEGGFSDSEAKFLKDQGLYSANLGKTILRGETAGIAAAVTTTQAIAFWAH